MPDRQSWDDNLRDVLISYKKGIYALVFFGIFIYSWINGWLDVETFKEVIGVIGEFITNL